MKNLLLVFMTIVVLVSCKKDAANTTSTSTAYMNFKLDSVSKFYGTPLVSKNDLNGNEVIDVTGASPNGDWINVRVQKTGKVTEGNYQSPSARIVISSESEVYTTNGSADIVITANDQYHIEGYFSGHAKANNGNRLKLLEEGKFYVQY